MSDNNLRIGLVTATPVVGRAERKATLTNAGPGTIYYKASSGVSSTSNDGSLAPGASLTFENPRWFIASGKRARAYVLYTPEQTTDMATQAELDEFSKGVDKELEELQEKIEEGEVTPGGGLLPWFDPYDYGYDPIAADNTEVMNDTIAALPETGGRILMPRGPVYCAGELVLSGSENRKGIVFEGSGQPLPGTFVEEDWPASSLIYTGLGTHFIDCRSTHGTLFWNMNVAYSEAFEGVLVDGAQINTDTTYLRAIGCIFQGVGRESGEYVSTAKALISLDQALNSHIMDCRFDHALAGVRCQEAGTYSNIVKIEGCNFAHVYAGVVNPGQTCTIDNNTFEGLQGQNPFYPHHAVLCDLPGGGSVTGVTIRNNWMGDAFGDQEWIKLKPLAGSKIEGNFISGGLSAIRFFNNEENSIVGSGVSIRNNNCSTPKGHGIDLTSEDNVIWQGLEIVANGLSANFAEGPILGIPKGSPDRDISIHSNSLRNPPPVVQPYFLTHTSPFTIVGGFKQEGDFAHTGTKVGFNSATPVVKANALTAINAEEVDIVYGEVEKKLLENLRKRSEEQETILKNLGVQK